VGLIIISDVSPLVKGPLLANTVRPQRGAVRVRSWSRAPGCCSWPRWRRWWVGLASGVHDPPGTRTVLADAVTVYLPLAVSGLLAGALWATRRAYQVPSG